MASSSVSLSASSSSSTSTSSTDSAPTSSLHTEFKLDPSGTGLGWTETSREKSTTDDGSDPPPFSPWNPHDPFNAIPHNLEPVYPYVKYEPLGAQRVMPVHHPVKQLRRALVLSTEEPTKETLTESKREESIKAAMERVRLAESNSR